MDVSVNNGNPADPVPGSKQMHKDTHVVDVAEAAISVRDPESMMSGGTDRCESISDAFLHQCMTEFHHSTGSKTVCECCYLINRWKTDVRSGNHCVGNRPGCDQFNAGTVEKPFFSQEVTGIQEPFLPFRMKPAQGPVKGREEYETCRGVRFHEHPFHSGRIPLR